MSIITEYITFIWIGIAVLFAIIEALTLGLTSIWFTGGAVAAFLVSLATDNLYIQTGTFIAVSIILLLVTRPLAGKHLNGRVEDTNVNALIGMKAIVVTSIMPNEVGAVRADGKVWSAKCTQEIPAGEEVRITGIRGVTVDVVPEKTKEE